MERIGWTFALPLAVLLLHAATASGYGVFRDELYYVACGHHLAWGYVDHPPMVAWIAALVRLTCGDSWIALRLVAALAAALTVLAVGSTAGLMGGGRWARLLAQLLAATAPIYLSLFSIYSMNALDVLVWAALANLAARALAGGDPALWLAFGAVAGVGLETKVDVGLLGVGLGCGILVSRRELLRTRQLWFGAAIAAVMFLPHVAWQALHDWPTREFVANAQRHKIAHVSPLGFVGAQLLLVGPVAAACAVAGWAWLFATRAFRPLGGAALAVLAVLIVSISKPYYFSPVWTLLFPAAGVALERWTAGRHAPALRVVAALAAASILVAAPLAKPLLSEDAYVRYAARLGVAPGSDENQRLGRLPQFFADMHGWEALARSVGRVAAQLPPEDRAGACVYGQNYGEAAAIDYYRERYDLPPAISGHNSYWMWGPGDCSGEVVLILGGDPVDHRQHFASVEAGGLHRCTDCMPYEDELTIWVARELTVPLSAAWNASKHYE